VGFFENVASEIRIVLFYDTLALVQNENYKKKVVLLTSIDCSMTKIF